MMKKHWRHLLAICLALTLAPPLKAQSPDLGGGDDFPINLERKVGDSIAKLIYRDPYYLDDPVMVDYLQSIWQTLLQAARDRGDLTPELQTHFAWTLFLDKDPTVNAYALPGGYLGIQHGLIALSEHRAEIASVLAHEMSHITQRHIARSDSQQKRQQPLLLAAMLIGIAAMSRNPEFANAAIVGAQAGAIQGQLNYSRDMEREADRVGFGILTQAGYAPAGMASMFNLLQRSSRLNDNGLFPYLRTHPLTTERIADAQNRTDNLRAPSRLPPDPLARMMAARARLTSAQGVTAYQLMANGPQGLGFQELPPDQRLAGLYAASLAHHLLRDRVRALQFYRELQAQVDLIKPASAELQRHLALLQAEIALGEYAPASSDAELQANSQTLRGLMSPKLSQSPRAVVFSWCRLQMQMGKAALAAQTLKTWVALYASDAGAWRLLAQAERMQGHVLADIRASAEAQAAELDYSGAMERLRAALRGPHRDDADHYEQSIIQSRLRDVKEQLHRQLDDEKAIRQP